MLHGAILVKHQTQLKSNTEISVVNEHQNLRVDSDVFGYTRDINFSQKSNHWTSIQFKYGRRKNHN